MINVRINLIARPGKRNELLQSISDLKAKIASESGCTACEVYQSPDNPDEFLVFEQWRSEEHARNHMSSANLAVLVGAGSVLSQKVDVSLFKDPATESVEQLFKRRVIKKELR